jgi:hypothetical protein
MDARNDFTVVTDLTPYDFECDCGNGAGKHLHMFYNAETNTVSLCDSEYEGFDEISKYVGWKHVFGEDLFMKRVSPRRVFVDDEHYVVFNVTDQIVEVNKTVVMLDPIYNVTVSATECYWTDEQSDDYYVSYSEIASRLYKDVNGKYMVKSTNRNNALSGFTIYDIPESKLEELATIMRHAYDSAVRFNTRISSLKLGDLFTFTYPGEDEPRKYRFICREGNATICEWLNAEGGAKVEHLTVKYVNKL